MNNKIHLLTKEERAYIAGFLEGDGSIFAQLVRRHDYRLKFQIKTTVNFVQKNKRAWFLIWLQSKLGCGSVINRRDGCWELAITQNDQVKVLLTALIPYLVMKNRVAWSVLKIIGSLSKKQSIDSFLDSCRLVDQVAILTDSKKPEITSETVRAVLASFNLSP